MCPFQQSIGRDVCCMCVCYIFVLVDYFDVWNMRMDNGSQMNGFWEILNFNIIRTYANMWKTRITFIYWHWKMVSIFILFFFKVGLLLLLLMSIFYSSIQWCWAAILHKSFSSFVYDMPPSAMPWLFSNEKWKFTYLYILCLRHTDVIRCIDFLTIWDMRQSLCHTHSQFTRLNTNSAYEY